MAGRGGKSKTKQGVVTTQEMKLIGGRLPEELMQDILYSARSAARTLAKVSDKQAENPKMLLSQLTTHQKAKVNLDMLCTMFAQPEILLPLIHDMTTNTDVRVAMYRSMLQAMPKELNVEVSQKTGIMLVPAKVESIDDWLKDQGVTTIDVTPEDQK